jgi:DUF4097 and DUF4098 domain-containing protein YvlB
MTDGNAPRRSEELDIVTHRARGFGRHELLQRLHKITGQRSHTVKDAVGSVHLKALSGNIEAAGLRSAEGGNDLEARAVSGDISLEKVDYQRIEANTVSGSVTLDFSPAKTGRYNVKTTSGDIDLTMPVDSSFQITAKVKRGDIVNEFALKQAANDQKLTGRLEGVSGAGDAVITLYSFSGTVSLRHK